MNRRSFLSLFSAFPLLLSACSISGRKGVSRTHAKAPLYRFIFCNDLHVSSDAQAALLSRTVEIWNTLSCPYDFVVVCGDLANHGTVEELQCVANHLSRLRRPWYPVIGNHDVTGPQDAGKTGYRQVFGIHRENYLLFHKNTALLFLDITNGKEAHVIVTDSLLSWLESTLASIPVSMPVLVFSHFPLHPDTPRFPVKNTGVFFELLDKKNVQIYLAGHYHARWHGERNNTPFYTNACLSMVTDNHDNSIEKGYLLVEVYTDRVKTNFIEVEQGTRPECKIIN